MKLTTLSAGCFLAAVGFLGTTHYAHAAALTSTNVEPASLVAGATGVVTVSFTTTTTIPVDGKIVVTFPANFDVSGNLFPVACSSMPDANFTFSTLGQDVTLVRGGAGVPETAGAETCTISGVVNPHFSGATGAYIITTTDVADSPLDSASVTEDTITAGAISSTDVAPATLVAGASGVTTVTFTTANAIPADGVMKITFGSGFNVAGAAGGACTSQDGTFVTTVSGQVVTLTRQADGTSESAGAQTCTINTIVNPAFSGSTGVYSIATFLTGGATGIDVDAAVTADTITVGALTSTNVQPASLIAGTSGTTTVTFTTVNPIPNNGVIKITFGSGYTVSAAASGTCSTQNGTFVTTVSSQTVILTRQADGDAEAAGAQACTIGTISNPTTVGTTGAYTIATFLTGGATGIDTDAAVTADTIRSATSSTTTTTTPLTYAISLSSPVASAAYMAGDSVAITWNTSTSTGSVSAINLSYSTDGGFTHTAIVSGTANDGSYTWTAPSISAQSITIRAEATDLVTALATTTSGAFSIGSTESVTPVTTVDTSPTSTTLLPEGTLMKGASWSTVYEVGAGATLRPFLDSQTFFTYYSSFDAVVGTSDDYMGNYTIGTPMLPKAGTVLVKVQSLNKVYALTDDSTLRWVTSESIATSLYGSAWADYVIDVPATAWGHFTIGADITSASDLSVDLGAMQTRNALNSK